MPRSSPFISLIPLIFLISLISSIAVQDTYGSRLGWKTTDRVIILHVDDVGMSFESNEGAIQALEQGVASSWSIMMPCPWVPGIFHYLKENPETDAGLHLTLTSEWKDYRWEPLSGARVVPGLIDAEGAMHSNVQAVVTHASPEEVDIEIRAQLDRCRKLGWEPTHLDSHMGTLFAHPAFLEKYIRLGMEQKIPIMLPAGHNTLMKQTNPFDEQTMAFLQATGEKLWNAGLPVIDDLHNFSYDWKPTDGMKTREELRRFKTQKYIESFAGLKPGITFVIMHCATASDIFPHISDSGPLRQADLEAMLDPELKAYLKKEGILITTWREMKERRKRVE